MTLLDRTPRVLVVDDDEGIRSVLDIALGLVGGFDVTSARSGTEALGIVEDEPFDVIVLDVMMPGLDGPSTLARLRSTTHGADVPVVFLTAKAQPHERRELERLGAHGVLVKPFNPLTLADDIRSIVDLPS